MGDDQLGHVGWSPDFKAKPETSLAGLERQPVVERVQPLQVQARGTHRSKAIGLIKVASHQVTGVLPVLGTLDKMDPERREAAVRSIAQKLQEASTTLGKAQREVEAL